MDSTPPSSPPPPPPRPSEPPLEELELLTDIESSNPFETDPLKVSLSRWQYWVIGAALLVLVGVGAVVYSLLPELEDKGPGYRMGFVFGGQLCVLAAPATLLVIAQLIKKYSTRKMLLSVSAWLLAGLTLLYVPFIVRGVINTKAVYRVKAANAANEDAKGYSAEVFQSVNDLTARLRDAGSIKASTMTTLDAINDRLALLAQLREEDERALTRLDELEGKINGAFDKHKVEKAGRDEFWTNFNATSGGIPNVRKVREFDVEIVKHMEAYVTVLRDQFGHWRLSGEKVVFENDDALDAFNREAGLINSLNAQQSALRPKQK